MPLKGCIAIKTFINLMALLAILLASGCATTPRDRGREMPEALQTLSPEDSERILDGRLAIGDTPDLVYIAWGRPDRRLRSTRLDVETETWIYFGYQTEYVDINPLWQPGFRRQSRAYYPEFGMYDTVAYRRTYARRRVEFQDGEVIAFEYLNR